MSIRTDLIASGIFALVGLTGSSIVWQSHRLRVAAEREAAGTAAAAAAFAIEQQVSRSLSATYALAAVVRRDESFADFESLAAEMMPLYGGLASLQLAPGGVIRRIHPLAGSEAALGHDLLADADRRFQAQQAVASRRLTVAGPFQLRQGGLGLVGRLAVFLPGRGGERFWGLVTAVIMVPTLLEAAGIDHLDARSYAYRLTWRDPERGKEVCFARCDQALAADPLEFSIAVPNGSWSLQVAPRQGWTGRGLAAAGYALVLAVAGALALLARRALRQPDELRRQVEARTAELARTNAALAEEMRHLREARQATREAEERLREAQKMDALGKMAGSVAHDFNNMLAAILGHASILLEGQPAGSEQHEVAETICAAARRGAELTSQLLRFARREAVLLAPYDVHGAVREASRLLGRTLGARVRIVERLAAARSVVVGDPGQLQQALVNLALNARDAMPEGGELRLETAVAERDAAWCALHAGTVPGSHVLVTVADSGKGITPEVRERLFEPFFTTKGAGKGTGLGLAVVYGVARSHGGAVEVESEVGRGARFTLSLPLAPPGTAVVAAPALGPVPRPGHGTALVVDDEPMPRDATVAMLRSLGYEPVPTGSLEEALGWADRHGSPPAVVLLDVVMPERDGIACYHALRARFPAVPVLFTSGYAPDGRAEAIVARGGAGLLPKPYTLQALGEALARARVDGDPRS